ncbi:MAG: hypothetical protein L0Y48_05805 [Fusobacteria bacterium]|nr:hypothetical protein [Fusobacteriota bacterium]
MKTNSLSCRITEKGQGLVEYALIILIVILVSIFALSRISEPLIEIINKIANNL